MKQRKYVSLESAYLDILTSTKLHFGPKGLRCRYEVFAASLRKDFNDSILQLLPARLKPR